MSRRSPLRPSLLRSLLLAHPSKTPNPPSIPHLKAPPPPVPSPSSPSPFPRLSSIRSFASSASPSGIVLLESEQAFNAALSKAQDGKSPSVFYFTAVWCGPCRFISPVIEEMSKEFPHVTTYKVDIDQEALGNTLSKLSISAVPTLHFFQNGKKADEVVGADVARLKETMKNLYT